MHQDVPPDTLEQTRVNREEPYMTPIMSGSFYFTGRLPCTKWFML